MGEANTCTIFLLGPIEVDDASRDAIPRFRSQRTQALLGYLVTATRPVSREPLAALFWPEHSGRQARANLRRELHNLNRVLPNCWESRQLTVRFRPPNAARVDVHEARRLADAGRWVAAAEWLRGEFLEGVTLDDNLEVESWLRGERERWRQHAEQILLHSAQAHLQDGAVAGARRALSRLIRFSPWHEEAHRQLMLLLARQGQFGEASRQYRRCQQLLEQELGIEPSAETRDLFRRIKAAASRPPPRLPAAAGPFVGREREVNLVRRRVLDPDCRLLTIVGLGGMGKSRLALEAVRALASGGERRFLHGVSVVPLSGVNEEDVAAAIATAIGVSFHGREAADRQLVQQLREREMLLLLDNYEHLLPHTALLEKILADAPDITLLVTSRRLLSLREEWIVRLEGLPYPPAHALPDEMDAYDAIQLFTRAVRRVDHTIDPSAHIADIAALCRLLQGMPLALLLAAAWIDTYSPDALLTEIKRNVTLLETRYRNQPARQRSVQAVFEASWEQLGRREQAIMAALSVFRGDFTAEAAGEVAAASATDLAMLRRRSLLQEDEQRYVMHELLRAFAAAKLAQDGNRANAAHRAHGHYYLEKMVAHETSLFTIEAAATLKKLAPERSNLLAAWDWAVTQPEDQLLRRSVRGLSRTLRLLGPLQEGQALFRQAVETLRPTVAGPDGAVSQETFVHVLLAWGQFLVDDRSFAEMVEVGNEVATRAQAMASAELESAGHLLAGTAHYHLRENEATRLHLERAVSLAEEAQAPRELARSLRQLGMFALLRDDDVAGGIAHLERALARSREAGDAPTEAGSLNGLGIAHITRDYERAMDYLQQTADLYRRMEDAWGEGIALINLGHMALTHGKLAQAQAHNERTLALKRRIGDRQGEGVALVNLCLCAHLLGEDEMALRRASEALAVAAHLGDRTIAGYAHMCRGHALFGLGQADEADDAYEQALARWREIGEEALVLEVLAGRVRVALRGDRLGQAWTHVEEIYAALQGGASLYNAEEPFRIYLTCYQALQAQGDRRSQRILEQGYVRLQERAQQILDPAVRDAFLNNLPAHRLLVEAYENGRKSP